MSFPSQLAGAMTDEERYIAEFEEMGEARLIALYEKGRLSDYKKQLAYHWLNEQDRKRSEASHAENAHLARSGAAAARDQADAAQEANTIARQANTIATLALILAIIAIAVSILDAFLD